MPATTENLVIEQGKTFEKVLLWETEPFITVPIASISKGASVRVVTQLPHDLPNGWRCAVVDAQGMVNLNAANNPPAEEDFRRATVIDTTTVEFNGISSASWKSHTAQSGFLQFYTPHDLTGYTARMKVKGKIGETDHYLEWTTENGCIEINASAKSIKLILDAEDSAEIIAWKKGVYDLELVSPTGFVTALFKGTVTVTPEITT
jgi:hypothetical protein